MWQPDFPLHGFPALIRSALLRAFSTRAKTTAICTNSTSIRRSFVAAGRRPRFPRGCEVARLPGAQKLHGRNVYQVLGRNLDKPSRFLVCWTPDGVVSGEYCTRATGGTGMAIRIACAENVPVLNLCRQETRKMLEDWVRADCALPEPWL